MPWNPTVVDSQILAIHAALVPNGDDGEVVLFGGDEHWSAQQEPGGDFRKTRVYDVRTHALVGAPIPSPDSDVFCAAHAFTADGRLLIVGGTKAWSTGHGHDLAFWGHRRCWLYNARERQWVEAARLLPDPYGDGSTGGGRWYPGAVTMGNGEVLALFGHIAQDDSRHRNASPERYNVSGNGWAPLPRLANDAANYAPNFGDPDVRFLFFTRTFQLPDGRLFFATPMPVQWASNTSNAADPTDGPHFSSFYDASNGTYVGTPIAEPAGYDGWSFPCVLLPLLPGEDYRPRVLHCGLAQAMRIDLGAAAPAWQGVTTAQNVNRVNSCAAILPTGQVCLVGGVQNQGSDGGERLPAELYDPGIDWAAGQYSPGLGSWAADPNLPVHSRNYHSAALLLPNGSVLTCGGNTNADSDDPNVVGVKRIELFTPAYPAGARPTISNVPPTATYGESFDVTVSDAAGVRRVALIRSGSCTHAYDFDQRYVGLEFTYNPGDGRIRVTAPPNGNVAPPGYYMLWVVDAAGRPCQVAKFVRIARQGCTVITDRSTFSREEVQALGGGGQATFDNAVYVQYDGFIHTELTITPTFEVRWADTNALVDGADFTLVPGPRLQEVNPGSPDIPQRITFPFHVRFANLDVYSSFADSRQLRVTFTLGHHSCTQTLDLTYAPNPYMLDIAVTGGTSNPAWLSTDVRVFSIEAGQTKFGDVTQGTGNPIGFIRQCLDKLNNPANNGNALFEGLSTSASLDLWTNGPWPAMLPIFNYAIARVRYRATTTTAQRVKCFFRMFNVAATGLEFDPSTTYRRTPVGPGTVPLVGTAGGEVASIPFFASERVETVDGQPGAASMATQPLDATYEMRDIAPNPSGAEVTAYFGCWLDINQTRKRIPISPGGSDGPWPDAASRSIMDLTRARHMCVVGEVFFEPDLTAAGETPGSSDNLSQRNLAILHSDNPGGPDSHTVMHTLEIKPSLIPALPKPGPAAPVDLMHLAAVGKRYRLDELIFRWHDLPADSEVTVYFSDIDTAEIQALAALRQSPLACEVVDRHTLRFKVAGLTWIPIPGGRELNIPALLSIKLPQTLIYGDEYHMSVHQVSGRDGSIIGSTEFRIPVSKAELMIADETRTLSVFKHILTTIPTDNRWYPLMQRYVHHMGLRVDALGGDAAVVHGNPDGSGRPYDPRQDRPSKDVCAKWKLLVCGLLGVLLILLILLVVLLALL
ncbi:MAG: galactose oxidase early set domain-containing protein [Actinomycetota bacterium]|nr:galactose oxidase early set domain-containing protein [Actinomycetota bacterium]